MRIWQLQEAKAKLTELINLARNAPQVISRHGRKEIVVMSIEKYNELCGKECDLVEFFRQSPLYGLDIEFTRDKSKARKIDL